MKMFISGLIMGCLLCSIAFANDITKLIAETVNFPVLLEGKPLYFDKPIVTIDGSTYIPLRSMGNALGVKVNWNEHMSRVEIGDSPLINKKIGIGGDVQVTILNITKPDNLMGEKPKDDNEFIVFDLDIKNLSTVEKLSYKYKNFYIEKSDGSYQEISEHALIVMAAGYLKENVIAFGEIQPNESIHGKVLFEVSKSTDNISLDFKDPRSENVCKISLNN